MKKPKTPRQLLADKIKSTLKLEQKALRIGDFNAVRFFQKRLWRLDRFGEDLEKEVVKVI